MNKIDKLNECIASLIETSTESIAWDDSLNLIDDLYFDSLKIITLVIKIEQMFEFEFEDNFLVLEYIADYSFLKEYICNKSGDGSGVCEE